VEIIQEVSVLPSINNNSVNKIHFNTTIASYMNLLKRVFFFLRQKRLFLFIFSILFYSFVLNVNAQEKPELDEISIIVQIDGVSSTYNIAALYSSDDGKLYIAVEELFQVLIIPCIVNNNGDLLNGFIENEKREYEINYLTKQIKFETKINTLENDMTKNMGMIYLESNSFEKIFGLHLAFNFRSLAIKVTSDFELPILKKQRIEKSRNSIQGQNEDVVPDLILKRNYHLFRYGNIDWSIMSSQTPNTATDSRFGLNLGAELLFGEADAFLNFSANTKPDPKQQQFYWRWVDNDKTVIRQIQAGNISNKTISSVNAPVHGVAITNTPTTIRKAKGEYVISDVTQPDWDVELYINNVLIAFTKADAAGQFTFKVPIVYGYTVLKLKFFGPMGEERLEEKVMNIPSNFTPSGVFEYKLSAGQLQDGKNSIFGRGEGNYGVTRGFTIGGGAEYLSSINNLTYIPFVSFSMLPLRKLILSGEYADKVRFKALMNYYILPNTLLELDYSKYNEGQKAILFNYLEERKIGLSLPMRLKTITGSARVYYKQNVFKSFSYNMVELMLSAFYRQFTANISNNANWISDKPIYMNATAAVSARLPKGYLFRPSAQFDVSKKELLSYKVELEKKVSDAGFCSLSFERNMISNFNSLNFSFKYDLSFAQTNISARAVSQDISLLESARGGIAIDDKNKRVFPRPQGMVARGGIAIIAYVDVNHNNKFDSNERKSDFISVKVGGGRSFYCEKDSIVRIMGLEPFIYYNVELEDNDFEFITWRIDKKNLSVLIDPNQFKTIEVPISPVAEISGNVFFKSESTVEGLGRVIVNIFSKEGSKVAKIITESDGYVSYLGLLPGEYYAKIDSIQLNRLDMKASPSQVDFKIKALLEGDVFTGLNFELTNKNSSTIGMLIPDSTNTLLRLDSLVLQQKLILDSKEESASILLEKVTQKILFDVGKSSINAIYKPYLKQVADMLKKNPDIDILLEGLCDIDGSVEFNQKLSVKRANSVRNELIKMGIDKKRIEVVGLGSLKALNSNSIEKSLNRRVEFKVNKKIKVDTTIKNNKNTQSLDSSIKADKIKIIEKNKKKENEDLPIGITCSQIGNYYVQCGVFKNKNSAILLAKKIKSKTDAFIGIEENNALYKVQVGCSPDKTEVNNIMQKLIERKFSEKMFIGIRK